MSAEGVDIIAVPIDAADDNSKLAALRQAMEAHLAPGQHSPGPTRGSRRGLSEALGQEPPLPSTVITDDSGHILAAQPGLPSLSELRRLLLPAF